jgi:raffinose/stachyose/melibiose transport system substrate-binding protein
MAIVIYGIYIQLIEELPSIYWINFKPEANELLQELAKQYKRSTGRNITILTPESGYYSETLDRELQSSFPPTLFIVGGKDNMAKYNDYIYDLTNTKIVGELNTDNFNLYTDDNKLGAIGYCYETFGIITNVELLEKSGHKLSDIKNFESLKTVV